MDGSQILQLLTALGVGAVLVEIVRSFFQRKNMGADYASVISSSAVSLLAPLNQQIEELRTEVNAAKNEVANLTGELSAALADAAHERELRLVAETEVARLRASV